MNVLWDLSDATVGQVVERLEGPSRPAYNSVLTLLRILERKGYVRHEKQGRAFTYAPIINRTQARRGALTQLLSRFSTDLAKNSCWTCSATKTSTRNKWNK